MRACYLSARRACSGSVALREAKAAARGTQCLAKGGRQGRRAIRGRGRKRMRSEERGITRVA